MTNWNTRPEDPEDRTQIRAIHLSAFPTAEEANLVETLRADHDAWIDGLSIITVDVKGLPVGHALLTRCFIGQYPALTLAPCAVLPEYQRSGARSAAIVAGLNAPFDVPDEAFLALALDSSREIPRGTIVNPPAFDI